MASLFEKGGRGHNPVSERVSDTKYAGKTMQTGCSGNSDRFLMASWTASPDLLSTICSLRWKTTGRLSQGQSEISIKLINLSSKWWGGSQLWKKLSARHHEPQRGNKDPCQPWTRNFVEHMVVEGYLVR